MRKPELRIYEIKSRAWFEMGTWFRSELKSTIFLVVGGEGRPPLVFLDVTRAQEFIKGLEESCSETSSQASASSSQPTLHSASQPGPTTSGGADE